MQTLTLLLKQDRADEALALFVRLPAQPETCALLLKHARTWHSKGMAEQQQKACLAVLAQDETNAEAWHLLGAYAHFSGDFAAAEHYFSKAVDLRPDFPHAMLALSHMKMLRSHFREGRNLYEARFAGLSEKTGADWRTLPITRWQGESLTGKSLYLWEEQGIGDVIMSTSLLPFILQQSPARVTLGVNDRLMTLMARAFPELVVEPMQKITNHVVAPLALQIYPQRHLLAGTTINLTFIEEAYQYTQSQGLMDFAAPLGDVLVYALPDFKPSATHYLVADAERKAAIDAPLHALAQGKRVIGISWYTSTEFETQRNAPLAAWLPLLAQPDCFFVSLQHHVERQPVQDFCDAHGCAIWQHPDDAVTQDMEALAALVSCMEHVVTIDNTNAHLAGALGVPTTMLLPKGYNYRWPDIAGGGSLWYPKVTTLRQESVGEWGDVMQKAVANIGR